MLARHASGAPLWPDLVRAAMQRDTSLMELRLAQCGPADATLALRELFPANFARSLLVNHFETFVELCLALHRLGGADVRSPDAHGHSVALGVAMQAFFFAVSLNKSARLHSVIVSNLHRLLHLFLEGDVAHAVACAELMHARRLSPRLLRAQPVLHALFSEGRAVYERRLYGLAHLMDYAGAVAALDPTRAHVRAVCPHTGNTVLHWAVSRCPPTDSIAHSATLADGVHALLRRGADPWARNRAGETPLDVWRARWRADSDWGASVVSAVHEVLEAAMDDVSARQLALAMAMHPRLGAGSLLLSRLDPALLALPALMEAYAELPTARRSEQALRAQRIRAEMRPGDSASSPIGTPHRAETFQRYLLGLCPLSQVRALPARLRRTIQRYGWGLRRTVAMKKKRGPACLLKANKNVSKP
jgi:hypothetical protein